MTVHDTRSQDARGTSERSLGELFGELGSNISHLLRKEIELAKVEARGEANRLSHAAMSAAVAGAAGLIAMIILSMALAWWIDQGLNTAVAFAIVGAVWLVVAAIGLTAARSAIRQVQPLPETTDAIKGAVTGERADNGASRTVADAAVLSPTHQISDTRRSNKETAS